MATYLYRLCGLTVDTDVPFNELTEAGHRRADFSFRMRSGPAPDFVQRHSVIHEWRFPNGDPWLSVGRADSFYVLRFQNLAAFVVSNAHISCYSEAGTPSETVRHLFLDQVVPLLLSAWGKLVLHASGVAGPYGALGFIGVSGAGKSTLAASFSSDCYSVLTDDCLVIEPVDERFAIRPNYPGLRLWPETAEAVLGEALTTSEVAHYTRKRRVVAAQQQPEVAPLRRLYLLAEPESGSPAITLETLPPAEAFIELVKYTFRLDVSDRKKLAEEFGPFSRLVTSGYIKRLRYPRELDRLSEVKNAVLLDSAPDDRPVATHSQP